MRNTFGVLALMAIALLMTGACETPVEDTPTPTDVPTAATPAPHRGIGVSRAEIQAALEEDPFGFTFDPPSILVDGQTRMLGFLLEEGQEGMAELIGPPDNLTMITIVTPTTGAYTRTGVSRLSEVAFHAATQGERGQGPEVWVLDHILLAIKEGPQSARYNDICMEMIWFENLQTMTLVVERCAP